MIHQWVFNVQPVPASRPRVGRWSTYYPKRYSKFIKQFGKILQKVTGHTKCVTQMRVWVHIVAERPKTTKRTNPLGDVDNFAKAVLDCCNQVIWDDDDNIVDLRVTKTYGSPESITLVVQDNYDLGKALGNQSSSSKHRKRTPK